ncbi:phosphatase PAP2 family protein [Tsuneonella sp. YG55]|uniref:Phosphatase PAP2 family protein n=1 Tax=Tsuneonella litorea TaxID=2976475 RepID=A0A9X2W1E9_9SPHN|nr:phosphatase PAP2 family protein [Tsuneonella litorea]MCT2559265.1 phosphatase PAP2 family protein [Tsuneonella litorea]
MRTLRLAAAAAALALSAPAAASDKDWDTASTIGAVALGAWAVGVPAATGDARGALQSGLSVGAAYAVSTGLKEAFPETRPDGSDNRSFPSGHTAASFAAAASIYERRGPGDGIPAFALASFVGLARVEAHKHHWYDVVAGAGIGTASGLLLTHPLAEKRVALVPWVDSTGGGATVDFAF